MQKLDRETSHFRDRFFIDFSRIFDPILHEKTAKTMEGCSFFMFSLLRLQDRFWRILWSFWYRFFFNFGSQNLLKTHLETCLKNHAIPTRFFYRFLMPSWRQVGHLSAILPPTWPILAPRWAPRGSQKGLFLEAFWECRARPPKNAKKASNSTEKPPKSNPNMTQKLYRKS